MELGQGSKLEKVGDKTSQAGERREERGERREERARRNKSRCRQSTFTAAWGHKRQHFFCPRYRSWQLVATNTSISFVLDTMHNIKQSWKRSIDYY